MEREEGQQQAKRGKGKMMDRERSQLPAKRNTGGNESRKKGGGGEDGRSGWKGCMQVERGRKESRRKESREEVRKGDQERKGRKNGAD